MAHVVLSSPSPRPLAPAAIAVLVLGTLTFTTAGAEAQSACLQPSVDAATNIDFEASARIANECITLGGLNREDLMRAYELVGRGEGALGNRDRAREAFTVLLAINPDFQLDRGVSPTIRAPYIEAAGQARALQLSETLQYRPDGTLRVRLVGPLDLVGTVRVHHAQEEAGPFETVEVQPSDRMDVALEGAYEWAYVYVEVVDGNGNVMLFRGEEFEPLFVGERVTDEGDILRQEQPEDPTGYYVAGVALTVLAIGLIGSGVAFNIVGNDAANDLQAARDYFQNPQAAVDMMMDPNVFDACDNTFGVDGANTLQELCPSLVSDATLFQPLGVTFYVIGGVLAAAAGIVFAVAPPPLPEPFDEEEGEEGEAEDDSARGPRLFCGPGGPGDIGAACLVSF